MPDRLKGKQRREFFVRHEVTKDRHLVKWYGLSLDDMSKAELRILIDNCCADLTRIRALGAKPMFQCLSGGLE